MDPTPVLLGQLLDLHLSRSIERLKAKEDTEMRGLTRLANATQTILKDMDDEAGQVADELIAAQAETKEVIAGFKGVVGDIRANNKAVRDVLAQITNSPPLPSSGSSNA